MSPASSRALDPGVGGWAWGEFILAALGSGGPVSLPVGIQTYEPAEILCPRRSLHSSLRGEFRLV